MYDVTKDCLYQQGMEQGRKAMQRQIIENLLKLETISLAEIAEIAKVPVEYVQQIANELKK